ncbi:YihY/virulence factor BrkB family protein [Piscinibacter sp.]|uniref:YihY/virulence factor BrkB family protein n=1 Tax=Piscinibacter sp. TaxID=1903157 RepID=UPI002D0584AA|nr:YihY/virulence factor BrkB family protein [Albitalea sp.]HUG21531.1 YihY/virulence factor BrkB family protein [Albitalea sp.]
MMRDLLGRLEGIVWSAREKPLPSWKALGLRVVRTALILGRDLAHGELTLRAMGLVYTTLLSIVPLLALSFSVLKAFGVSDQIRPMLANLLAPLGEKGAEVTERIVQFIQNMNVGVLGALGLALLLYTAISLMHKIEESLNFIWHVPQSRRLGERFSRYLSVLMVGPILVFSALGITATVMNFEAVRGLMELGMLYQTAELVGRLMPYVLVIGAFTFIYLFIPNTRVHYGAALVGGAVGGIAWQTAGWAFAIFAASSNRYSAIYSSFAILLLFMIWLYLSWLILLFGASVAFYVQHPEYLYARGGEPRLSNRMRERLALSAMSLVAGRFLAGERAPSLEEFTRLLQVPMHALQVVLDGLERDQLLTQSGDAPPRYLPGRDPSLILLTQVLDTVRAAGEERFMSPAGLPAPRPVDEAIERIRQAVAASVGDVTLRDLAAQGTQATPLERGMPEEG